MKMILKTGLASAMLSAAFTLSAAADNLIVNGNFSDGFNGFTSGYTQVTAPYPGSPNGMWAEETYTVWDDPADTHSLWQPIPSGNPYNSVNGQMLIVNGSQNDAKYVWQTSAAIDVEIGQDYYFQAIVTNLHPVNGVALNGAKLTYQYSYDGSSWTSLGTDDLTGSTSGVWQISDEFVITDISSGSVYLRIANSQTALAGNDFAIGLINFDTGPIPVPEPGVSILLTGAGMVLMVFRRRKSR
jgi:hypothetical protein